MASNFLKYSNLTYDEILKQINDKLASDPKFANFRQSSIAQMFTEIFAGTVDLVNYYLSRRAEECYFDSAQLKSSVILLSRQLGYVVQRPIPASAKLQIKLKGDFTNNGGGVKVGTKLQIPFHSMFTYGSYNLILKRTFTVTLTSTIVNAMNSYGASYESDYITVDDENFDIDIVQGEIKEKVIDGTTNPQISQKFQLYKIEDNEFSNTYGDQDFDPPTTKVWVGNTKTDNGEYTIDRRSLVNWQQFSQFTASNNKLCVVRSAITEDVELMFGDAKYTAIGASVSGTGPATTYDNIYIQYLATKGAQANQTGLIDKKLNYDGQIFVENTIGGTFDVTDKVEFYFKSNLIGGADMEDIDSIRVNAPNIYYSLDRLVTAKDYISFLKTLTSPIIIRNALAWGEQEECLAANVTAIKKLFNIVFYSCIGDMYQITQSPYYVRTKNNGLDLTVLDNDFDENEIAERNYYNVYTFQEVVKQLKEYETASYFHKIVGYEITATQAQVAPITATQNIIVYYKSTTFNTLSSTDISVNVVTAANDDEFYTNIASSLQSTLTALTDDRVGSPTIGLPAFQNLTVTYDSVEKNITIQNNDSIDNCYVYQLSANNISFVSAIGLNKTTSVYYGDTTVNLSDKIITMTNTLKERSMITIQNVYISPIIQNFNIVGKVYINSLTDKETLRVDIANAIYTWLNINADFNLPIYKSNIIDIINAYNDVKYCNVYFEPEILTPTDTSTFYNNGDNKYLNDDLAGFIPSIHLDLPSPLPDINITGTRKTIANIIDDNLNIFLSSGTKQDPNTNNLNISAINTKVQDYNYQWNSFINERNFFSIFVKNVYDELLTKNSTIQNWARSDFFMKEMSLIHKDLLKIIRYNMMDTSGNIAPEYDSNGNFVKGGYSIGNEIVKMNVMLSYEYKS